MQIILVSALVLTVLVTPIAFDKIQDKIRYKKVASLIDEKIEEWVNRGLKEEEALRHSIKCLNAIRTLRNSNCANKELLTRSREILEDQEKLISFESK